MRSFVRACGRTCCSSVILIPFAPPPQTTVTSYSVFASRRHNFYCFGYTDPDDSTLLRPHVHQPSSYILQVTYVEQDSIVRVHDTRRFAPRVHSPIPACCMIGRRRFPGSRGYILPQEPQSRNLQSTSTALPAVRVPTYTPSTLASTLNIASNSRPRFLGQDR